MPVSLARKVISDGIALTLAAGGEAGARAAIVVPVPGPLPGLLWIDRTWSTEAWDSLDAMAAAVVANLIGAALVGANVRDELARGKAAAGWPTATPRCYSAANLAREKKW